MINRLIIIGNGFDIAHGLKTKYCDFVEDYYSKLKNSGDWNDDFFSCSNNSFVVSGHKNLNSIIDYLEKSKEMKHIYRKDQIFFDKNFNIRVNNNFFYKLSKKHSIQNWVDIENEYFKQLLIYIDIHNKNIQQKSQEERDKTLHEQIKILNREMDGVAAKFEKYLIQDVVPCLKTAVSTERQVRP